MTVVCVLRSGGDFCSRWVKALRVGSNEYAPEGTPLVCLTDMEVEVEGVRSVPLTHGWPGWWSKLEALRPDYVEGPVLYMDLDTLPVGDLSDLLNYSGEFAMIRDLGSPQRMQSGVMAFQAGPDTKAAEVYEAFQRDSKVWMRTFRGDGEFLHASVPSPDVLQDLYPESIVSYKWQCRHDPPEGPALVLGHGRPRFSDPAASWAHDLWRRRAA